MRSAKWLCRLLLLALLSACGGTGDDLAPSGSDERASVEPGTVGPGVGQRAPDFTAPDTLGSTVTLSRALADARGAVLYFTMWCPVCDSHMSDLRADVIPLYPDVRFLAVDYVSGSVSAARDAEVSNGYAGSGFEVLVDLGESILDAYDATMGTTVVVDAEGIIRMNEDYKDGDRLRSALSALP